MSYPMCASTWSNEVSSQMPANGLVDEPPRCAAKLLVLRAKSRFGGGRGRCAVSSSPSTPYPNLERNPSDPKLELA